ncbi:MAG TPA: hypothetical protein VKS80_11220 [Trinickia sp.]|nr:hypothetical protein [Trinickia sp.]
MSVLDPSFDDGAIAATPPFAGLDFARPSSPFAGSGLAESGLLVSLRPFVGAFTDDLAATTLTLTFDLADFATALAGFADFFDFAEADLAAFKL